MVVSCALTVLLTVLLVFALLLSSHPGRAGAGQYGPAVLGLGRVWQEVDDGDISGRRAFQEGELGDEHVGVWRWGFACSKG